MTEYVAVATVSQKTTCYDGLEINHQPHFIVPTSTFSEFGIPRNLFDTTRVIGSILLKAASRLSSVEISCSPERHLRASVLDFNVSREA